MPGGGRFNEAAGIHRRKPKAHRNAAYNAMAASMRPPEFTGGNEPASSAKIPREASFNEAAGIHRRKRMGAAVTNINQGAVLQ